MDLDFEKKIIALEEKIAELNKLDENGDGSFDSEIAELQTKLDRATRRATRNSPRGKWCRLRDIRADLSSRTISAR